MNRKQAELEYQQAIKYARDVEYAVKSEDDADILRDAINKLNIARSNLVTAEANEPTKAEEKRRERNLYLRNRGYDC